MKISKKSLFASAIVLLLCSFPQLLLAQKNNEITVEETILKLDSTFWVAYNNCNTKQMEQFIADDVEFYHDKGGPTFGLQRFSANTKSNLCGNPDFRLRRDVVKGSVKVYPLTKEGTTYGAIISGDHEFSVLEKGKQERVDGLAKFTHLWILEYGSWKMKRILSYDHGPAPFRITKKEMQLPDKRLSEFVGKYIGPHAGSMIVEKGDNNLVIISNNQHLKLYPEADNLFFSKERDLTFEFTRSGKRKIAGIIVRENGAVVEEAIIVK
ncbi:nuclear transport factor 2 family protein [Pontibacter sp. 13R65]|uniref:nuclear transport factor 2 family protein n=1 Tax=Pontibacter sp. 13R65 TaxID=3127458 RepID=UPI00301D35EE